MTNVDRVVLCDACWKILKPGRVPSRVIGDALSTETCHVCKDSTRSGIYVMRADAALVSEASISIAALRSLGYRVMPEAEWAQLDGIHRFIHGLGPRGARVVTAADAAVLDACAEASIGMGPSGVARIMDSEGAIAKAESNARKVRPPAELPDVAPTDVSNRRTVSAEDGAVLDAMASVQEEELRLVSEIGTVAVGKACEAELAARKVRR